jgi:hypothetical protein
LIVLGVSKGRATVQRKKRLIRNNDLLLEEKT